MRRLVRTLRQVDLTQSFVRAISLSAICTIITIRSPPLFGPLLRPASRRMLC